MAKKMNRQNLILTTSGADGACSAAMALLADKEARILVTSTSRFAATLQQQISSCGKGVTVSVCGVGLPDPDLRLAAFVVLDALRQAGADVVWYCGRGYMDGIRDELRQHCTAVLNHCSSNTEAVFRHLRIGKNKKTAFLLDLADEYVAHKPADALSSDHKFWHDFIKASAARYFYYDDDSAYPACIRKLAGLEEPTPADLSIVEASRRMNNTSLPLGNSPVMKRLRTMIKRLGPIDEPVLILGPSGAGKEVVAQLLHEASSRAGKPFIPVNCAILSTSSDMANDRLFGHEAGSFTGAKNAGTGAFETADDGTLFLDEVAELPLDVQTQLLRVLEEGKVVPLGTMSPRPVNVRIVAATNRNLAKMVAEGAFRLDLYHRLNVLSLDVPPLTERREDMKSIANSVIHQLKEKGHALSISADDWKAIGLYTWPGNVRQFINLLKRASYMKISVAQALTEELRRSTPDHLSVGHSAAASKLIPQLDLFWPQDVDAITPEEDVRKAYMQHCLDLCGGSWTLASQKLGVAINTLRKWLDTRS